MCCANVAEARITRGLRSQRALVAALAREPCAAFWEEGLVPGESRGIGIKKIQEIPTETIARVNGKVMKGVRKANAPNIEK